MHKIKNMMGNTGRPGNFTHSTGLPKVPTFHWLENNANCVSNYISWQTMANHIIAIKLANWVIGILKRRYYNRNIRF